MTSSSSSSHTAVMDQRGFVFALPHLGLPEPEGEWCHLKAAIATKAEALDLLLDDKAPQTPLRYEGSPEDTAIVPIEFEGALWILFLHEPKTISATAGVAEFFSVRVKRFFPDELNIPRCTLPSDCDWVFFPMSVYQDQLAEHLAPASEDDNTVWYAFEAGSAWVAKILKERQKNGKKSKKPEMELSELEVLSSNFLNDNDWCRAVKINTMLEQANRGHLSLNNNPDGLRMRIRVHPVEDHDYRSLDYCVISKADDEKGGPVAGERWKPLPPGAAKPGAERHWVNIARMGKGKRPFSKEEWPPAPVAREGGSDAAKG